MQFSFFYILFETPLEKLFYVFRICQSSNETFDTEYDYIRYKEQTQRPCTGEKKSLLHATSLGT